MNTVHTSHERSLTPDDSRRFVGLCHDALAVAYGTGYYADELNDISTELCAQFTDPVIVECEEYAVVRDADEAIGLDTCVVSTERIAAYTTQPYPQGTVTGLITPELIALTESDITDRTARTPYVMIANASSGRVFFVKVQDVQGLISTAPAKLD